MNLTFESKLKPLFPRGVLVVYTGMTVISLLFYGLFPEAARWKNQNLSIYATADPQARHAVLDPLFEPIPGGWAAITPDNAGRIQLLRMAVPPKIQEFGITADNAQIVLVTSSGTYFYDLLTLEPRAFRPEIVRREQLVPEVLAPRQFRVEYTPGMTITVRRTVDNQIAHQFALGQDVGLQRPDEVQVSEDGQLVAISDYLSRTFSVFEAATGERIASSVPNPLDGLVQIAASPDHRYLLGYARMDQDQDLIALWIWDLQSRRQIGLVQIPRECVETVLNDRFFYCNGESGRTFLYKVADGGGLRNFPAIRRGVISPDGNWAAAPGTNATVDLYRLSDGTHVRRLDDFYGRSILGQFFSPDSQVLVTVKSSFGSDSWGGGRIRLHFWRVSDGQLLGVNFEHRNFITSWDFSPDGRYLATADYGWAIKVWRVADGAKMADYQIGSSGTGDIKRSAYVQFTPDGKYLRIWGDSVTREASKTMIYLYRVGDWQSGIELPQLESEYAIHPVFSPDSSVWAIQKTAQIDIYQLSDGALRFTLSAERPFQAAAFSPDGRLLAAIDTGNLVYLWRVTDGRLLWEGKVEQVSEAGLGFSPDGQVLAVGGGRRLYLWRVRDGVVLLNTTANYSSDRNTSLRFTSDGRQLLINREQIWGVPEP